MKRTIALSVAAAATLRAAMALAAPTSVTITPPDGARILAGQRFDLRVEGKGTAPFSATLLLDGKPVKFTSGVQNSSATGGITSAGWGGFNVRAWHDDRP
jgi:hypothetical protein